MLRTLEQMNGSVALGFSSEDQLLGVLVHPRRAPARGLFVRRDRARSAGVATSIGITVQNSQVYERMKERDRLAALGQMAAGLAHEIRNPLGVDQGRRAVPAAGPARRRRRAEGTREFLDIIVEEVNRLNKIVSQFLDYARPYRGEQRPLDVDRRRSKKTLRAARQGGREDHGKVEIVTDFADELPPVRADAEQLLPGVPEPRR